MSDYLSNLAVRNSHVREQNTSSLLRPRLPSLFESSGNDGQFSDSTPLEQTSESVEPSRTIWIPSELKTQQKDSAADAPVIEPQKHLDFAPLSTRLNPPPLSSRLHSLSTRMDHPTEKREQTIQVHIGRVEIRAVTASRPTSSKPSSAPNLTLEQYLRQRNEGKR
jgi:hypothetical protein